MASHSEPATIYDDAEAETLCLPQGRKSFLPKSCRLALPGNRGKVWYEIYKKCGFGDAVRAWIRVGGRRRSSQLGSFPELKSYGHYNQ